MHRKFRLLSPRKASSHRAVLPSFFSLLCAVFFVFIPPAEAYSLTTDGCGIFNERKKLGACCAHEAGRGVRHEEVCTRVDSERQKKKCSSFSPPEDRTNTSDLNSDSRPLSFFLFDIKLSCILKLFNPFNKLCNSNNSKLSFDLHSKRGNRT